MENQKYFADLYPKGLQKHSWINVLQLSLHLFNTAAACQGSCWWPWPQNDSYKQKSNSSATGTNANDHVVGQQRYRKPLCFYLHGDPAMEKPIIFPQWPCQVTWKLLSRCRMPSAGISSISHMACLCYLLTPFVICIISMWQMGIIPFFPNKMNWAFKGA